MQTTTVHGRLSIADREAEAMVAPTPEMQETRLLLSIHIARSCAHDSSNPRNCRGMPGEFTTSCVHACGKMKKQGRCDSADSNSQPNSHQVLVDVLDKEGFTAGHGHESPRGDTPPEAGGTNCMALALTLSLLFNVLFVILCVPRPSGLTSHKPAGVNGKQLMEWSRRAAVEAEAASAFKCSGHGQLFVDTLMEARESNSTPVCECNDCFTGDDCSEAVPDCRADSSSGDPLMFEAFWKRNAEASAVVIPGWYSMSYKVASRSGRRDSGSALGTLERQIRAVHELVGNAVTEGRHIVLGTGSAQLVAAAINSISQLQAAAAVCEEPTKVVAPAPYCNSYASQTQLFRSTCLEWAGDARQYAAADHGDKVQNGQLATAGTRRFLEIVASPNNPDGKSQEAVLSGNGTRTVYDLAYYWPHFTPISGPADHDVMLFSLSKLTGHAGSRIGWALVKDIEVAEKMNEYLWSSTMGVSHESQLRATQLLRTVMSGYTRSRTSHRAVQELSSSANCEAERHASPAAAAAFCHSQRLFHYAHALLSDRWERLRYVLFASSRFKLQKLQSQNCTFFGQLSSPSPAFAWIQCTRESERDCAAVLREAGIVGESGSIFGADASFVRLSLMNREQVFQNVLTRLRHFADPDAVLTTRSSSGSEQASS